MYMTLILPNVSVKRASEFESAETDSGPLSVAKSLKLFATSKS